MSKKDELDTMNCAIAEGPEVSEYTSTALTIWLLWMNRTTILAEVSFAKGWYAGC